MDSNHWLPECNSCLFRNESYDTSFGSESSENVDSEDDIFKNNDSENVLDDFLLAYDIINNMFQRYSFLYGFLISLLTND